MPDARNSSAAQRLPAGHRWVRRTAITLGVLAIVGAAGSAWLLRDPTPWFRSRRSVLVRAEQLSIHRADGYVREDVRLHAASGLTVDIAIRYPVTIADSTRRRLTLFFILGGYETGKDAVDALPDTRETIIAALQYPYSGRLGVKGLAVVPQIPAIRRALLDTPPAVMIALDYLRARPDVDTSHTELVGASFGAPFAVIAAALDRRVTRLWVLHGAADPYALFEQNLKQRVSWAPLRAMVAGAATLLSSAPRLDPSRWIGLVSPRPVVLINARDDERIPVEAVLQLYESAGAPRTLHWLPGPHMQRNRKDVLTALVDTVLSLARADSTH